MLEGHSDGMDAFETSGFFRVGGDGWDESAIQAVQRWRFSVLLKNGVSAETIFGLGTSAFCLRSLFTLSNPSFQRL